MNKKTYAASATLNGRQDAEMLANALEKLAPAPIASGFFELSEETNIWEVAGYFDAPPDEISLALLGAAFKASPFTISKLGATDWIAEMRRALHPIEVGRFFLHASHDKDKVLASHIPLLIDASTAFGTGHHDTTRGCLWGFDDLLRQGKTPARIADIGTGTGVLAMAAAKALPNAVIYASDIDPIALEVAQTNIVQNQLEGRIECVEAAGFSHPKLRIHAPYELIFANILKEPLMRLAKDFAENLCAGGLLILSGILHDQSESVIAQYQKNGLKLKERRKFGIWECLHIEKPI